MFPDKDTLSTDLKTYVRMGVKQRYDRREENRKGLEGKYDSCLLHGGEWDTKPMEFRRRIKKGVLEVARNVEEADVLLNVIFSGLVINPGECGGDEHSGHYQDYDVLTGAAIGLAENTEELRKYLKTLRGTD
ncbi:MAG: hypothetical protein ISS93_00525 [Candidatus Aenigmarchaeota archaeon]|nr:hypothetical protein [Candidatus Aenigmarchaeota archaeon]